MSLLVLVLTRKKAAVEVTVVFCFSYA